MNANDFVICTEGLSKSFGEVHALKLLNLRVPHKSIFAFLGPNGAGKTTTIKLLLGLLKPTSGGGKILGRDIVRESVDIRAKIGYLPQDARFYEHMTARQTLEYTAGFFYAGPRLEIDKRVNENKAIVESGALAEGSYLWSAVATLNSGAEASGGRMNKMDIVFDNSVTRLVLTSPKEGQRGGNAVGIAPLGARLSLNGKPVSLDDSGRFSAPVPSGSAAIFKLTTREGADSYWVRRLGK